MKWDVEWEGRGVSRFEELYPLEESVPHCPWRCTALPTSDLDPVDTLLGTPTEEQWPAMTKLPDYKV